MKLDFPHNLRWLGQMCITMILASCTAPSEKPREVKDEPEVARHQQERHRWEQRALSVRPGMTRAEVERVLPRASFKGVSWEGRTYEGAFRKDGLDEWYYLSPHFICEVNYDYTGLARDVEEEMKLESKQKLKSRPRIVQVQMPLSRSSSGHWE